MAESCYAECHCALDVVMLNFANDLFILSVIMPNVIILNVVVPLFLLPRCSLGEINNLDE
jgi:hypothetical protein